MCLLQDEPVPEAVFKKRTLILSLKFYSSPKLRGSGKVC